MSQLYNKSSSPFNLAAFNASEATRIELQPENLDYVDVDDPVQRAVDDVSDEESDEESSVNDADEDPDIYTTAPQWTITTSGTRPIQFTKFEHINDAMLSRLTLLSAFGSAACAREYMSDNARCCGVRRRLMTDGPERTSRVRICGSNAISRHFNT
ncbi:hypothetical protein J6590_020287 [Homalodisca vitripennis]|nr:hypothetical protein J6590_020287 [Homalodisca vitripennis]